MRNDCKTPVSRAAPSAGVMAAIGVAAVALNLVAPKLNAHGIVEEILDRSGAMRFGKASFYASFFAGRRMADGTRMEPLGDGAASKTLPLGTIARVTNLETGKSAIVTIRDRGPYVAGRIVDVSPATARKIGLDRTGVAEVVVAPIAVPTPEGGFKAGAAAAEASNH
jgi:rare lipoprotein A